MNMTTLKKTVIAAVMGSAAVCAPSVFAESSTVTGAGALSTAAKVDIQVVIPRFLQFQVGTAGATVDQITFNMSSAAASVGNSVAQAGTGGNLGAGAVTVNVKANSGQVTITPTNNSAGAGLGNGTAGQTIAYTEILTASSAAGTLPAPVLSNAGGTAVTPTLSAGAVTNRTATWTYTYANTTVPNAGTYGTGGTATGGRVTYTATTP
jgi:hypothetical protein